MADNTDKRFAPCPHCGGEDIRSDCHHDSRSATGHVFSMCCYNCGARVANCCSIEPMLAAWNRRAPLTHERELGVADAIRVIKGMGNDWPNALAYYQTTIEDEFGKQFVTRILEMMPTAERFVPYGSRRRQR